MVDLCVEGWLFKNYHESLLKELNRREGNYGKKEKNPDEEEEKKKEEKDKKPVDPEA